MYKSAQFETKCSIGTHLEPVPTQSKPLKLVFLRFIKMSRQSIFLLSLIALCGLLLKATALTPPWDASKFRPILRKCRLQSPTASPTAIKKGDFPGKALNSFYLSREKYMTFEMSGDSRRSELRVEDEFSTRTSSKESITGSVKLLNPSGRNMEQFTFMQILGYGRVDGKSFSKPLLRLTWLKERRGTKNHLWAIIRTSLEPKTQYIKLIKRPSDFLKAKIEVQNSRVRVFINGSRKVNKNVSYWNRLSSYFKAGVYLQDPGTAKTQFRTLTLG